MNINEAFPFLNEALVTTTYYNDYFNTRSDRYFLTELNNTSKDDFNISLNNYIPIIRIMPNDIYICNAKDLEIYTLMNSVNRPDTVKARISEVDYARVANQIEFTDNDTKVVYPKGSDYIAENITTTSFIQDAQLGMKTDLNDTELSESLLNEDAVDDLFQGVSTDLNVDNINSIDAPYKAVLDDYLSSDKPTEQIPLLVGMSGVAKSATVKELAEKHGMRMVDLRVSFMSRLDIDGLVDIIGKDIGQPMTMNAPMVEFLTCTDEYIDFSNKALKLLKDKRKEFDEDTEQDKISAIDKLIDKFTETAKIPVLFLDEISRSDKSIRGALTTIINQRVYNEYHLKKARIVAATNAPVGYEDDPDMQDIFLSADIEDVAVLDRFNKIKITPEDMYPSWIKWAKQNLIPAVTDYIESHNNPAYYAYNMDPARKFLEDPDREDDLLPPYPTFRAWENISNYLKSDNVQDTKEYSDDVITGLLSREFADDFEDYLNDNGYKLKTKSQNHGDKLTDFVEDSLDANLPTMITGVSGLGKTTRVREYCEKRGYDFNLISLSTKDRLDIMGPPAKVDIINYIAKDGSSSLDDLGLRNEMQEIKEDSGLPNSITVRSPKSETKKRLEKAAQEGKPVVFFFDELNRCPDPTVQSAIFQCISDNSFAGVHFKPGQVKVAMAGNVGESTDEAGSIDAALAARTVQYKKTSYDLDDAKAVRKYMKDHHYDKALQAYLSDDNKLLDFLKTVDEGTLTTNVSSTRSIKSLSDFIKNSNNSMIKGNTLFKDSNKLQDYNTDYMDDDEKEDFIYDTVDNLDSWCCKDEKYFDGTPMSKIISIFKQAVDMRYNNTQGLSDDEIDKLDQNISSMIYNFSEMDKNISDYRKKAFSYYVGEDFAKEFGDFYNSFNQGLELKDLYRAYNTNDTINVDNFLQSEQEKIPDYQDWFYIIIVIFKYYKDSSSYSQFYVYILTYFMSNDTMENNVAQLNHILNNIPRLIDYLETFVEIKDRKKLLKYAFTNEEITAAISEYNSFNNNNDNDISNNGIISKVLEG